jgi:hypothetical protein
MILEISLWVIIQLKNGALSSMINENSYIFYNWMPAIADHAIDRSDDFYKEAGVSRLHNKDHFDPADVQAGDIIYVKTDYIFHPYFQNEILPKIKNPFKLISGISSYHIGSNGDLSYQQILQNPNLIKWSCTNPPDILHDKIIPLPIGFEEKERAGGDQSLIISHNEQSTAHQNKKKKILLPYHTFNTNPERQKCFEMLSKLPFVDTQRNKLGWSEYMNLLNEYQFVICLEGSGPDVHRNYECLAVGTIPINLHNTIYNLFSYHHIPGIFLNTWDELTEEKFNQISNTPYNMENVDKFLKIDYHLNLLRGD